MKNITVVFLTCLVLLPCLVHAQNASNQSVVTVKARVVEIVSEKPQEYQDIVTGVIKISVIQEIKANILEGDDKGKTIEFSNDYIRLKPAETFYVNIEKNIDGTESYSLNSPYRLNTLFIFLVLFILVVYFFGGSQGVRGLASLGGSLVLIIFVLIPSILNGFSPIIVSLGVSSLIIILGSYITHGFNKTTTSAVAGMIVTVLITGLMAYYAMDMAHLEGLDEYALYLNIGSQTDIDLVGLLFGGIMIGLLGVLYDAAIGQAVAVEELHKIAPHVNRWKIYQRGIRIGKEHIGALVDTIAIAYVGVSLPLILIYVKSGDPFFLTINKEIFATEIIRILTSSIGLVLAVPITTLLAVYIIVKNNTERLDSEAIEKEENQLEHKGHIH